MAHRGAQHVAKRLESLRLESRGIETCEAPILAGGVEHVGWGPDREMPRNRRLLIPGIEAIGLHPDRDIEIEADLHAQPLCEIPARSQLLVRDPLHEFNEFDRLGVRTCAKLRASCIVRLSPMFRPFPPW